MTQRAGYERDVNACNFLLKIDNIVFPGGQADIG